MYSKIAVAALAGLAAAAPAPVSKRAIDDATILNYALTLEHLENAFYKAGLANFTQEQFVSAGFADPFYQNLKEIAYDEQTHVDFLTDGLKAAGAVPVAACNYTFPVTDPKSFVAVSQILEGVGVSAYLGAAKDIMKKEYLTAAGSILTVEARHNSYIRASQKQVPFPQAFDAPLSYDEVYSLAAPFFKSCPKDNPTLPVKAFPAVAVADKGEVMPGQTITLSTPGYTLVAPNGGKIYAAFIAVTGPTFVEAMPLKSGGFSVVVPKGFAGQTYAVLTACNDRVDDDSVAAGPAIIPIAGAVGMN